MRISGVPGHLIPGPAAAIVADLQQCARPMHRDDDQGGMLDLAEVTKAIERRHGLEIVARTGRR